jgi:hypothetical protein
MSYFRLPYFLFPYSKHDEIKEHVIKEIYKEEGNSVNVCTNSVNSTDDDLIEKTDYYITYTERRNKYQELLINNNFTDEINMQLQSKSIGAWKLIDMWYQIYTTNGRHDWHIHGGSHWSFVYYLQLPPQAKGTMLRETYSQKNIELNYNEGDVLIFPSQVTHCSPINFDNREKIIVAGNIDADYSESYNKDL